MKDEEEVLFEAWLNTQSRIVSFHEITAGVYYSAPEEAFWAEIVRLVLEGYRIQ